MKSTEHMKIIDRWLFETELSESWLGLKAAKNQFAVERIRRKTATVGSYLQLLGFIETHPAREKFNWLR